MANTPQKKLRKETAVKIENDHAEVAAEIRKLIGENEKILTAKELKKLDYQLLAAAKRVTFNYRREIMYLIKKIKIEQK